MGRYIFHAVGSWNKWNAMVRMLQQCRIPLPDIAAEVLNNRLQRFSPAEFQEFLRLLKKFAE